MQKLVSFTFWMLLAVASGASLVLSGFYLYLRPGLPSVEQLRDVRLQTPLRIYSSDNKLIAEFGEKRRSPITIDQIPQRQIQAFLAAEDSRFFSHHGVDFKGLMRAFVELATTGEIQSGGSTITMQVAKNYFLSREKTFIRKFNEIFLAIQIEQQLDKREILSLYLNKIYLGSRAYGIEAAAQVYYGKSVGQLSLAQMAMIAGLPKAPSAFNPLANPTRALIRRNWILSRMLELGQIQQADYQSAIATPLTAVYHDTETELEAPYVAEMARAELFARYGEAAYTDGLSVHLTIDSRLQTAANKALRTGLEDYDQRHGYRGPIAHLSLPATTPAADTASPDHVSPYQGLLNAFPYYADLRPALVLTVTADQAQVFVKGVGTALLSIDSMSWARPYIDENRQGATPKQVSDLLQPGDVIHVHMADAPQDKTIESAIPDTAALPVSAASTTTSTTAPSTTPRSALLAQLPAAQGALVGLQPHTGAILSLAGGYSFSQSKYNRATQALRQPGSNFKPFIYLAALEKDATAATIINDAPIVYEENSLENAWRPENSNGSFEGPTRLRQALYRSRNLVSIRLLREIGIDYALDYIGKLGFDTRSMVHNLSLALGTASLTPLQVAEGFAVIANGGYDVDPYLIQQITDNRGERLYEAPLVIHCDARCDDPLAMQVSDATEAAGATGSRTHIARRVAEARSVYILQSILRDVITRGTGTKARELGRADIAGKTGTTNDQKDAWFSGFNYHLAATAWVGFDQPAPLGRREFGAAAALPIWMRYMAVALQDTPPATMPQPPGLVTVRIDPETGRRALPGSGDAIFEIFKEENAPAALSPAENAMDAGDAPPTQKLPQELF